MVGQRALSFGGAAVYMHLHETCDVCRSCRAPLRPHCIDARQPRYRLFVDSWGAWKTSVLFTALMLTGVTGWAVGAGIYPLMAISVAIWGLGFASTNSMQQVRLVGTAPSLASASVSLNTSVLYIGQAVGSTVGGFLYARDLI
jgi:hypothetical protein